MLGSEVPLYTTRSLTSKNLATDGIRSSPEVGGGFKPPPYAQTLVTVSVVTDAKDVHFT